MSVFLLLVVGGSPLVVIDLSRVFNTSLEFRSRLSLP